MKQQLVALAVAVSTALAGIATVAPVARADEVYRIDGEIWDHFQGYLRKIGHGNKPGAYAITTDGTGGYYVWCEEIRCVAGSTYSHDAKSSCEREYGTDCVVFAIRDEIRVKYEIVPVGGSQ